VNNANKNIKGFKVLKAIKSVPQSKKYRAMQSNKTLIAILIILFKIIRRLFVYYDLFDNLPVRLQNIMAYELPPHISYKDIPQQYS